MALVNNFLNENVSSYVLSNIRTYASFYENKEI